LIIVIGLMSVALAAILSLLTTGDETLSKIGARSISNDQARLGMEQIDRQVRSGNLLYDPATESNSALGISPGLSLRIYTQANSLQRCRQWRISSGKLQTRAWSTVWQTDGNVTGWRTVAEGIQNTSSRPAFALASGSSGRTLSVDLFVNTTHSEAGDVEIRSSITGRNTQYGYPNSVCSTMPS
jgi:hypothetical protein